MNRTPKKNASKPNNSVVDRIARKPPASRTTNKALRVAGSETKREAPNTKRTRPADSIEKMRKPKSKLKGATVEQLTLKASAPRVGLSELLAEMEAAAAKPNDVGVQTAQSADCENICIEPTARLPKPAAGPWSPMILLLRQQTFIGLTMLNLIRTQQEWFWRSGRLPTLA